MKKETWQEIQWVINNLHAPIRAETLAAQNWANTLRGKQTRGGVLLAVAERA